MIVQAELAVMATPTPCPVPVAMLAMYNLQQQTAGADEARRREAILNAMHTLDGLLQRHPNNPQVLLARSELALNAGDLDEAYKLCREVLQKGQRQAPAVKLEAQILLARGEAAAACEKLFELITQYPTWVDAHLLYAKAAFAAGRHEPALQTLRDIVRHLDPANATALRLLAETCLRDGFPQVAFDDAQQYIRAHPDDPTAIRLYVELARQVGRPDLARATLNKALEGTPGPDVRVTVAEGLAMLGEEERAAAILRKEPTAQPATSAGRMSLARALLLTRQTPQAEAILQSEVAANPGNAAMHFELGRLYVMTGRLLQGAGEYRQAAQLEPRTSRYAIAYAQSLLDSGDLAGCDKALAGVPPEESQASLLKLRLRLLRGEPLAGQELVSSPQGLGALPLAMANLSAGQPARCIEICQAQLLRNADDPDCLALLAEAHLALGQRPQALAQLKAMLKLVPDDAAAYFRLAALLRQDNDEAATRQQLASVPGTKPYLVELAMAWTLQRGGDLARAVAAARRLAEDSAAPADVRNRASMLCSETLAMMGQFDEPLNR